MPRVNLDKYRQAAKELRYHLNSQKFRLQKPERAFINWYILARFGAPSEIQLLDGSRDGGLDAITIVNGVTYILQSKYELVPRIGVLSRREISDFEVIAQRFKDKTFSKEFTGWITTVRPAIQPVYLKLQKQAIRDPRKVRFVLITTRRFNLEPSELVEVEDAQNITSLWNLYREGFTPPTEFIELAIEAAPPKEEKGFTTYVGLADVKDFITLMEDDKNERLFAQNVRTDLRSQTNRDIRRTYEEEPERFWLGNNGIYIVCRNITASGRSYRLTYPSIINGSQTLHSIFASHKRHSCKILVRILKMDVLGNPNLLSAVIRRTNTQNPMKLINLSAHDPFQLNIARFMDRYKLFYERREKEWLNEKKTLLVDYVPINIKELGQWLSTLHGEIGFGRARSRVSELFQTRFYRVIFGDFDPEFQSSAYIHLSQLVWSGLFVEILTRSLPRSKRKFAKISHLLLVRAVYESIVRSSGLPARIDEQLSSHRYGRKHFPARIRQILKGYVDHFLQLQRKAQKEDANVDFSNFFKRDDLTSFAFRKVCTKTSIRGLTRALERNLEAVR